MKEIAAKNKLSLGICSLIAIILTVVVCMNQVQANNQASIIDDLKQKLIELKVPVKEVSIVTQKPFEVQILLQSTSEGKVVSAEDPLYAMTTEQVVNKERREGIKVEITKIVFVNTIGEYIAWSELPLDEDIDKSTPIPSNTKEEVIASSIRSQVPLKGMSIDSLDVVKNSDGLDIVTIALSVADIETANSAIPSFMPGLAEVIDNLKTKQGAQFASYTVTLVDSKGTKLLSYVKDFQPSQNRENWWQSPELTQDWFPHPAPAPVTPES